MIGNNDLCPCQSGGAYGACCMVYHKGKGAVPTALALVRSRYAAYVLINVDYLLKTTHPSKVKSIDCMAIERWARESMWLGLEIIGVEQGLEMDKVGKVEFKASYKISDQLFVHHELSRFNRYKGRWYYLDGKVFT